MKVIRRRWYETSRADTWTLYPIGDVHLGNKAADESMLKALVKRIAKDDRALWIGLGDYCEFISRKDRRFSVDSMPRWLHGQSDINGTQRDRFLDIIRPIAGKCLGLVEGNHERTILDKWERDIYLDIVTGIREAADWSEDHQLAFGYSGWLMLHFYRNKKQANGTMLRIKLHHGFVGGRLAGAKALNMQRALWSTECDLMIWGHSHDTMARPEAICKVRGNREVQEIRKGCIAGSFLGQAGYAEVKGYFPTPLMQPHIILQPGAHEHKDRIKVVV